jgi:glucose-6-phosphate isomerase
MRRLQPHAARLKPTHLRDLYAGDPARFEALSATAEGLLLDLSREKLDATAMAALVTLAEAAGLDPAREALFTGNWRNMTEDRAVLHPALRDGCGDSVAVDGTDVMPEVRRVRDAMLGFAEDVRTGRYAAADGAPFTDVVNIGIGGSDLGPAMAVRALSPWCDGPRVHFVSNVDGTHLADTLRGLDPARTLVVVASKTFTTLETMMNARSAQAWLSGVLGDGAGAHMAACSTNLEATAAFGIAPDRVFGFWDWVGGRFSVWSAIGLPLAIAIGAEAFRAFLVGGAAMDRHFRTAPLAGNLPVLLALTGIWRRNAMGCGSISVVPYEQRLELFPAFLQQLEMESTGKGVGTDGAPLSRPAAPVVWGAAGTNAQHSFFQMLHQGREPQPVDFLLAAEAVDGSDGHHSTLIASALAQARALAFGDPGATDPHRQFPGDRPSTMLLYRRLDPETLGKLTALWEHKIFTQGVIWGLNAFDQFGVELGKRMTADLVPALSGEPAGDLDSATLGLIGWLRGRG